MASLERKLVVMVVGCRSLPPHSATGVNDAYVSLRLKESFEQICETAPAVDPLDCFSTTMSNCFGSVTTGATDEITASISFAAAGPRKSIALEKLNSFKFGSGAAYESGVGASPVRAIERRGSIARRRSTAADLAERPREYISNFLSGHKHQSKLIKSTSNPEYGELFIFDNLPIPLLRRSQSMLINNSLSGGSDPSVVRSAAKDKRKLNQKFSLHIDIYDNTSVKGLGEKIASCDVGLDELNQGRRTTVWVPLTIEAECLSLIHHTAQPYDAFTDESVEEVRLKAEKLARQTKPMIGLVLEPVNFGVLEEKIRNEGPGEAILRALCEELLEIYSDAFISKIHEMLVRADAAGMYGFTSDEMGLFMQQLYFTTGVSTPSDEALEEEMKYLFALFDKDTGDEVNVSEICGIIKTSNLTQSLSERWRRSAYAVRVVNQSSIAGCQWDVEKVPPPFEYAGYRRPDGVVNFKTKVPSPIPGAALFKVKPYVNLYKQLYGDEEHREAILRSEMKRLLEEEAARIAAEEERIKAGGAYVDDTVPMFELANKRNIRYTAEREEKSLAMLFAPPMVRSANDPDLPTVFNEILSACLIEYSELRHCTVTSASLVGCRLDGGRFIDCIIESCIVRGGAEIVNARSLRCSEISRARITNSNPVNCRISWSETRACELISQCTLSDCDISQEASVVHCYLRECNVDSSAKDLGANVLDCCRMLPAPKVTLAEQLLQ